MSAKTDSHRTTSGELPRDARSEEILEFVYNDEEEALCSEHVVLSHQRDMPALQEYLQNMYELDSRNSGGRRH